MRQIIVDELSPRARAFHTPGFPYPPPADFEDSTTSVHVTNEPPPDPKEIPLSELSIQYLQSADDIARMATLRREIDLSAAASVDPRFAEHEKKETSWGWSLRSNCMVR
jgi:hypothetical protein